MIPVILSGGSGTRLWPVSRALMPKQFCHLLSESLMAQTLARVKGLGSPWALTVQELEVLTKNCFSQGQFSAEQILFEPLPRNTAPAIALLCQILKQKGREKEIAAIFPADHRIEKIPEFISAVRVAESCAEQGYVATIGILPNRAATGFGYIETLSEVVVQEGALKGLRVNRFHEKPSVDKAKMFIESGRFFWNAGIFVFRVQTMIAAFVELLPEVWDVISELKPDLSNLQSVYERVPNISIDYGIMEKLQAQVCVPADLGWSDLGSWDDVAELGSQSPKSLSSQAELVAHESKSCFVFAEAKKVIGLCGVEDLIVADTADALLVARRGETQNIKHLVENLAKSHPAIVREHRSEVRPWGRYTVLRDEPHYKAKIIVVNPGSKLSYQSHNFRAEQWVVVKGVGEVTLNGESRALRPGESVQIPVGAKHRMHNPGPGPLEFVEVQTGDSFAEADITRYQDDYNRV